MFPHYRLFMHLHPVKIIFKKIAVHPSFEKDYTGIFTFHTYTFIEFVHKGPVAFYYIRPMLYF